MRRYLPLLLLAAGCSGKLAVPAGPIEEAPAPPAAVGLPGPIAVRTTVPAPPTPTPSPSPPANSCDRLTPCGRIEGRVYDAAGRLLEAGFHVSAAKLEQPGTPLVTAEADGSSFRMTLPGYGQWIVTVTADGFAPRERLFDYGRGYDQGQVATPTTAFNFGGPATSADPDAPAFPLPGADRNGRVVPDTPLLPFEESTVTTIAGDGKDESLHHVSGLVVAPDGRILLTEAEGQDCVVQWTPTAGFSLLAGGPLTGVYPNENYLVDGQGLAAHFYAPRDLALGPDGVAIVADTSNASIRRVTPDGYVTTLAGSRQWGYKDGVGASAAFGEAVSVAVDRRGNTFVADASNHCIRKVTPEGVVTTFAGANEAGWANGRGAEARFRQPSRLAIDASDALYVSDTGNHRIRRITPDGVVSDAYGMPRTLGDGSVAMPAVPNPGAIAVDHAGNLFFSGRDERVFMVRPDGRESIAAGYGLWGFADGTAKTAYFAGITALTLGPDGALYLTESGNGRIRRIEVKR